MKHGKVYRVRTVSEELASLTIGLGNSTTFKSGFPKLIEELNDLPREEELKPGSDEEANMGVRKMRVPSSELLEKMKAIAISEDVWTNNWITFALTDVEILKRAHSGNYGSVYKKHMEFVTCPEGNVIEVVKELVPPQILHLLATMAVSSSQYEYWPSEDLCRELVTVICNSLKDFRLCPRQTLSGLKIVFKTTSEKHGIRHFAYGPISDLYVTGGPDVHPLVLWGEIDSNCQGRDFTKALVSVHAYARFLIQRNILKNPTRFLVLYVSYDVSRDGFVSKFTIFDVVRKTQQSELELKRCSLSTETSEFDGAVEFLKVCAGLLMAMCGVVEDSKSYIHRTVKAFQNINKMLKPLRTKTGQSKRKDSDSDDDGENDDDGNDDGGNNDGGGDHGENDDGGQGSGGQGLSKKRRGSGPDRPQGGSKRPRRGGGGGGSASNKGQRVTKEGQKRKILCTKYRSSSRGYSDAEEEPHEFEWESESSSCLETLSLVGTTIQLLQPISEALDDIRDCLEKPGEVVFVKDCDRGQLLAVAKLTNIQEVRILRDLQVYSGVARIIAEKKVKRGLHLLVTQYAGQDLELYCWTGAGPHAMEVVVALLNTMHNIHNAGIVHLDIKPANIAVPVNATKGVPAATILDFGISCRATEVLHESIGTEGWMAPEMEKTKGIEKINLKLADVWAVGKVLLFMASRCSFDEEQRTLVVMLGKRMSVTDPDCRPSLTEVLCQVPSVSGQ
ncbi:hypothetical protein E1B28_009703 [Marasmius oreades]|uniref:Protein kinase domain-containing protein n=1 Tax=Marasmius oreades TaxID=181124 RepID=A0A9P7RVU1_9AGAR|nr:uncharacterized protein E1B28_009703 [Marasmius oreades]KAG7090600.1 hypothetical protein E1B28_009703 [Marasmius oreades]